MRVARWILHTISGGEDDEVSISSNLDGGEAPFREVGGIVGEIEVV